MPRTFPVILLVLLSLVPAGCRKKALPKVAVGGTASDQAGKPLDKMIISFHPQDEENKFSTLQGALTAGKFEGQLQPGKYKVTLAAIPSDRGPGIDGPGGAPNNPGAPGAANIPEHYLTPEKTPWTVTIPADGDTNIKLTIK